MEKYGACIIERYNKKCSCARKNGRRKNNAGTDKEEENKLAGPLAKKELPAEGCSRTTFLKLFWSEDHFLSQNSSADHLTVAPFEKKIYHFVAVREG